MSCPVRNGFGFPPESVSSIAFLLSGILSIRVEWYAKAIRLSLCVSGNFLIRVHRQR